MLNRIKSFFRRTNPTFIVTWLLISVISGGFLYIVIKGTIEFINLKLK